MLIRQESHFGKQRSLG